MCILQSVEASSTALPPLQVLDLVGGSPPGANNSTAATNATVAINGTAAASDNISAGGGSTSAGIEGRVSSPISEPAPGSGTNTRPVNSGNASGEGSTSPSEGTTTVQLGVSSGGNAAERRSTLQAAALMAAAGAAAALLLSAL